MTLTFDSALAAGGITPAEALVIRHAYVEHDDGTPGIHADSTTDEIMAYTRQQVATPRRFPAEPPPIWIVLLPEGGDRARLWAVVRNHGEIANDGSLRTFDLEITDLLSDLQDRLVIGWKQPRRWWIKGTTAAAYAVREIADTQPITFPGFSDLTLEYHELQAVMRERRYEAWRTALASVAGVYLITDTRDGRQYVGKADGSESIRQRWTSYATNGHGDNVELRKLDPSTFRFSILRVFDPATPEHVVNGAEIHFKHALSTRAHGLNRN